MTLPVPGLEFLAHVVVELDEPLDLGVLTVAVASRRASAVVYDAYTVT
jgi:hypothetical protein